jgi:hypothetical protein
LNNLVANHHKLYIYISLESVIFLALAIASHNACIVLYDVDWLLHAEQYQFEFIDGVFCHFTQPSD